MKMAGKCVVSRPFCIKMLEMAGDVAFLRTNGLIMYAADEAGVGPLGAAVGYTSILVTGALVYHCHRVC